MRKVSGTKRMRFPSSKSAVLGLLRAYKLAISPLFPPSCRYVPTCSEYAAEAIDRHGVLRGAGMAIWRLLRCHPFVKGGFDPVPLEDAENPSGAALQRTAVGGCPHASTIH